MAMASTKIKPSKEIADELNRVSDDIKKLSKIVYSDEGDTREIIVTEKEMLDWLNESTELQSRFTRLHNIVFNYIVRGEKDALKRG